MRRSGRQRAFASTVFFWQVLFGGFTVLLPSGAPLWGQSAETPGPSARFRTLQGRHLTLITDLPSAPAVDELPAVFDQAVGLWCDYFDIRVQQTADWHIRGYLMTNRDRFRHSGWLPADLPPFLHGIQRGDEFWLMDQPSDYYRRHLLLHEGTHAFMTRWLGGTGMPWYREGIAELLATHRYRSGRLTLKILPRHKDDVPEWGRIKLVRQAVAAGRPMSIAEVLALPTRQFRDVEAYGWSWAATTFLEGHPRWHDRFQALSSRCHWDRDRFYRQLLEDLSVDRDRLEEAWLIFQDQLDYGYDVAEDRVIERAVRPWHQRAIVHVNSRWGWQSTGLQLDKGRAYRITARGQFRLNGSDPPWRSEAGGVTIRYCQGRPTGMLLAAVRSAGSPADPAELVRPTPIGLQAELKPSKAGVLFLRINERAGQRGDNEGLLQVEIVALPATTVRLPD